MTRSVRDGLRVAAAVSRLAAGVLGALWLGFCWRAQVGASGPTVAQAGPAPAAQRTPVLPQVRVPHSYYYREMYLPQVTSGPAGVTWSPDGQQVVYAMQGSLWRQRLDSAEATQLTAGDGYDHQPDWSPDGRWIVYSVYRHDAIELWLHDTRDGSSKSVLADGAVNVEPRWSPDGTRIAFVSTTHEGRWHVFVAGFRNGTLDQAVRITEDRDSGLPRYYYSAWDHYLSPTWSPDGSELIVVSNRGRIWGTGGFWRMPAQPGSAMREIHYEETTWKARPDWAPDGRRVVYSGYHGRQWNQLWLMTSESGDPFQLTYGEFDATAPRWSRDGRRIAYVSNEGGNTSLWVVDVPGGRTQRIDARSRRYKGPVGTLEVRVTDAAGQPMPARVSVFDATGKSYAPDHRWRHADEAFVRGERQFEYGYFHTEGVDTVTVPAGRYTVEAVRGPEYGVARAELAVGPAGAARADLVLGRLADMPARGWWSGDLHVHMNYGGAYRNTPSYLKHQAQAEGLHVVENLIVNKEQRIPDIAYFSTKPDAVSDQTFLLMHGEEYHTSFWGHSALLGLKEYFVLPNYAGYVNTAASSLVPTNTQVFEWARAQGAITGYVHPFDTRPDPFNEREVLRYALPVDVARGTLDYLEVMGFSDHLATSEVWYRLLNCGFRIPAAAGTDAFPNYASLRGPVGLVRVFAKVGETLDHDRFLRAIREGRTFVTNAPLIELEVTAGRGGPGTVFGAGDEVHLPPGRHTLLARVALASQVPVDHLEVLQNGRVVASVPVTADGTRAGATVPVEIAESGWLALRAYSRRPRLPVLDLYPFASTSPIYVTVGGRPARSREDAAFFVTWIDRLIAEASAHKDWNTPDEKAEVSKLLVEARAEFERRR